MSASLPVWLSAMKPSKACLLNLDQGPGQPPRPVLQCVLTWQAQLTLEQSGGRGHFKSHVSRGNTMQSHFPASLQPACCTFTSAEVKGACQGRDEQAHADLKKMLIISEHGCIMARQHFPDMDMGFCVNINNCLFRSLEYCLNSLQYSNCERQIRSVPLCMIPP